MEPVLKQVKEIFSENIRLLRHLSGLTQMETAEILMISRSTYSAYENGDVLPDLYTACLISSLYCISLDTLCSVKIAKKMTHLSSRKGTSKR